MSDACVAIVVRDDPHLYATALFAPEPARSRLMVLYAFDCELSRAVRASTESLIPRMRLQWWRDVIEDTAAGVPPKAHEVAGPLATLLVNRPVEQAMSLAMIDAYEMELNAPFTWPQHQEWAERRFGSRLCLAANALNDFRITHSFGHDPNRRQESDEQTARSKSFRLLGRAIGGAFAIRHAQRIAAGGRLALLPAVLPEDLSALARGELGKILRKDIQKLAKTHIDQIAFSRRRRRRFGLAGVYTPVLLPLLLTERVLRLVLRPDFDLGDIDRIHLPLDGLRLAWRAVSGRW